MIKLDLLKHTERDLKKQGFVIFVIIIKKYIIYLHGNQLPFQFYPLGIYRLLEN